MSSRASSANGGQGNGSQGNGSQGLISALVAKAQLSALLDRVEGGDHIVITRRNRAIAELKPVQPPLPSGPRPLGQACDAGTPIPASFLEPLPDDVREAFKGRGA